MASAPVLERDRAWYGGGDGGGGVDDEWVVQVVVLYGGQELCRVGTQAGKVVPRR